MQLMISKAFNNLRILIFFKKVKPMRREVDLICIAFYDSLKKNKYYILKFDYQNFTWTIIHEVSYTHKHIKLEMRKSSKW